MSNRDGKTAKHNKEPFRKGQKCPRCKKGKLEGAYCHNKLGHEHHIICTTCGFSNF